MVGIYCWHQYNSNPAMIQLWSKGDRINKIQKNNKDKDKDNKDNKDKD